MTIYMFLDHRKRLTRSNIEPRGRVTETEFRSVSAGFGGGRRSGSTQIAAERTGPGSRRVNPAIRTAALADRKT